MLYSTLMLMMSSAFLMLRLSPGGSFPRPLSEAEERKYLEAWLQGDLEARNVLIEHNLRLVAHIIKKYYTHYDDTDDLISLGTIGLIKGINTYRPDKGVRLATYASRCAENEILMYFRSTRKNAAETLLSDVLDTDGDGNSLSLIDILSEDEDMDARLQSDEVSQALRRCIGEVLEERENGTYFDVVKKQVEDALFHLSADDFKKIILAYEPVWAIGTGKTATAEQAQEIHAFIRSLIADKYGKEVADNCSILYGGSCKPSNAKEIFSKTNVDGGLIGGAALKAEDFMGIVDAF